ncbi:uncharacterized protein TM35_000113310 [Trypanosoma theileri]|uniref:Uncharacterized protein n=1 Tax=Trypanosoma theileri TaxID=67003 RepID=A0A1X0NYP4_9TRYP|nr:uncharacterized protein TM35_000113310 [Trypanosoma theileri]ORC89797.1 hypothetical protein TM35_000113310 [Trypanosoma theileri]
MAEIPLLPQQQRTTTRYNPAAPQHRPVAFRPKLRFSYLPNPDNTICPSPHTPMEENSEEKEEKKEKEKQQQLISSSSSSSSPSPLFPRALYWLMYAEEQERALLHRSYAATSPLLQYDSDAPLAAFTQNAFKRREARLNGRLIHRQQLEADEAVERWRNVEEPWERGCHKLRLVQEMLEGKLLIWDAFLRQLNIWQQLLQLITEEKRARISLLASFISCKYPLPCRCLLWDMEVLEESAILLEPAVNLPCLFVSIVIGEYEVLHNALLAQRKKELALMKARLINCMKAFEVLRNIELHEQESFETLMGYHAFCMKIAKQEEEKEKKELALQESNNSNNDTTTTTSTTTTITITITTQDQLEVKKPKKPYFPPRYSGTRWSPYMDFFQYLHIVKTLSLEETFRREIETFEGVEACYLMYVYQTDCRLVITTEEENARRTLLMDMEDWERDALTMEESRSLEWEIQPDNFLRIANNMMRKLKESRAQELELYCINLSLQLLVEYEHQRRGELILLEKKVHTERRLFFCRLCENEEKRLVDRWMLKHEMLVLMREEERVRLSIEREETESIVTPATVHKWMVDYTDESRRKMQLKEIQFNSTKLLEEYKQGCKEMEFEWAQERLILFEKKLTIPLSNDDDNKSTENEMDTSKSSKNSLDELDIRRTMISDLADFLDDHTLLTIFTLS